MPLSRDERYFYRLLFQIAIFRKNGQEYEDLLTKILKGKYTSFQRVKPRGKLGDRKTDGVIPNLGIYFQVYSPEKPENNEQYAIEKAAGSILEISTKWENIPIKEYNFAFNDKYTNAYAVLIDNVAGFKNTYKLDISKLYLARDLEDDFMSLDEDNMTNIFGMPINPKNISTIDYSILSDVLKHIMETVLPHDKGKLHTQEFEDKIIFNNLSEPIANALKHGNYQQALLDNYFKNSSTFTRTDVCNHLNALYIKSRDDFSGKPVSNSADLVCLALIDEITPKYDNKVLIKSALESAWVIISYFFETCDIFEKSSNA